MGADNFAKFKVIEEIGKNHTKIIPDILIQGSGDNASPIAGLLGFELLKKVEAENAKHTPAVIGNVTPSETADGTVK